MVLIIIFVNEKFTKEKLHVMQFDLILFVSRTLASFTQDSKLLSSAANNC